MIVPWAAPPRDTATVQLMGDAQSDWETITPLSGRTNYDAIGRDLRDNLLREPPLARFQMGDISDGGGNSDGALIRRRFDLFEQWCGSYGLSFYKLMGNHDVPYDAVTPAQWAAHWGYPGPSYTVDLGRIRAVVLGPSSPVGAYPAGEYAWPVWPVRPLSAADLAWLDARLAEDTRPTLVLNHASLSIEPTSFGTNWDHNQSTHSSKHAPELVQMLADHRHVIAWAHGHTHDRWDDTARPNTGLMTVGGRQIARIDAGATYSQHAGAEVEAGVGLPVTFYVSVLDDGRTVEVRWRQHEQRVWAAVPGIGRAHRLTAT